LALDPQRSRPAANNSTKQQFKNRISHASSPHHDLELSGSRFTGSAPPKPVKTILIVDDSEDITELMELSLSKRGYEVLCCSQLAEALNVWEENAPRIDLLITDVKLGESSSGLDLAERLLSLKPGLRILAVSGFLQEEPRAALDGKMAFLHKPFRWDDLAVQVEQLLTESDPVDQLTFAF
jgi:DNA-binding NtrC family response regulator